MQHRQLLIVPKNPQGMEDNDFGNLNMENILVFSLPREEFTTFVRAHLMDEINRQCGILLDEYEDDIIPTHQLKIALEIIRCTGLQLHTICQALQFAIECNTYVEFNL